MNLNRVREGLRVIITKLMDTRGMFIERKHLDVRKIGITGVVRGYVPGHGGDVWFIKHDKSSEIGAYMFTEFNPIKKLGKCPKNQILISVTKHQLKEISSIAKHQKKSINEILKDAISYFIEDFSPFPSKK